MDLRPCRRPGRKHPLLAVALAALVAGCGGENRYVAPPPPQVKQVKVALPVEENVTRYLEATGNTAAVNTTNLVARVQGFV
jgi:multidrug efflux pump subunit AcrA (membrane-fusion protein)